jgi:NitT/TauT family transport system permease protein
MEENNTIETNENVEEAPAYKQFFKIREDLSANARLIIGLAGVFVVLFLWFVLSTQDSITTSLLGKPISNVVLPSPGEVLSAFAPLHTDMELTKGIVLSLKRVTYGFIIAATLAIPLGILMGSFPKVGAFFDPLALFAGYIPIVTLIPLTMAIWGLGEAQKVGFLVIGIYAFLLPMVAKTVQNVDSVYLNTGYTLGANRLQTIWHILIPITKAKIFGHCRFLYGVGWTYIILAEYTDLSSGGLGSIIALANRRSFSDRVFAVLITIVIIAVLVDTALKHLGYMLFPYEEEN